MTPLCELAMKHGTDKYAKHLYTPVYYDLFKDRISNVKNVLEIGIGSDKHGLRRQAASLYMWRDFFPNAAIIGLDIKPRLFVSEDRIKCAYANQKEPLTIRKAAMDTGAKFDLIIDDGSHRPEHQISSALTLVPFLSADGVYVIEDIMHNHVLDQVARQYKCKRVHTNPENADSVLGIIRR